MRQPQNANSERNSAVTYAVACFLLILVTMQLWLLTATMNAFLGGDESVILPAAFASVICFALSAGLVYYAARNDH